MYVWVADNQCRYSPSSPVRCIRRNGDECDYEWQCPKLAEEPEKEALVYPLGEPGPEEELDDEEDVGRDCEKVGFEGSEAEGAEVEG